MKTPAIIFLTLALAVPATWVVTRQFSSSPATAVTSSPSAERKLLYYQSAMHPWIKSDKPGRCTICGMELTPVYEGSQGLAATGDMVSLSPSMIQVLHVQTMAAKIQPVPKTLTFAGTIDDDARRHRLISAYVDGRIEKLYINHHGAEVIAGKPLAEIYSPALLQAEREYRSTTGELHSAVGLRLRQLGLSPEQIAALPKKPADALTSEILAPIGGTVVNDEVFAGQYVTAGQKLFEIADFSTMWFVFRAYEQDIPWLEIGQSVAITTPSVPGTVFHGNLSFIDPNFDQVTRTTQVRVELPNPRVNGRRQLLHRLYADGAVTLQAPEVLTVPRSAVVQTGPEAVVYVDHGEGVYARHVVKLGRRGDSLVEVLSGLQEGDEVVTNGNLLIDGQAEMNRSFAANPSPPLALTQTQSLGIESFVRNADALAAALASDDLSAFNKLGPTVLPATEALAAALKARTDLSDALQKLSAASQFRKAADLAKARKMFHPFSSAASALLEPLREKNAAPAFEVFECPMVDSAVPGAPKKGRWLQAAGTTIRNPYLGKQMPTCGEWISPRLP